VAEIVILGAGLTGLSAAYHLEQKKYFDYKIFEKESTPGGLLKSFKQDGFTFDFTGHLLHVNDEQFRTFLDDVVGIKNLNLISRKSGIYTHDTSVDYPIQMNLHGLPTDVIYECIEGYINRKKKINNPKNFHDWVLKYFGPGLGKHFFFSYNGKLLAYDVKKVLASWTGRFVPQTSLQSILYGALEKHPQKNIGYNSFFYYPKKDGIEFVIKNLLHKISNNVHTNFDVTHVDLNNKVIHFSNGHQEKFKKLITTIPLKIFLSIIKDRSSSTIKKASEKLLCTSVLNFNIGFDNPEIGQHHWLYFPEKQYPYYRIGFWNNICKNSVKQGCSAIYGETAYLEGTKTQNQANLLMQKSIKNALKFFKFSEKNIATEKLLHIRNAYVIYDDWREKNINTLHKQLNQNNVYSIGRYGGWKYSSMQEDALDGKKTIENIL
jgi:protoporphyrinogen oxidase